MATKQEIKSELIQSLSSSVWQKAKNALVGQELLSWATETIYAIQSQREAIENIFTTSQVNLQDIIRLSNSSIPTVQLTDPNYMYSDAVTGVCASLLPMASEGDINQVLEPFQLKLSSGGVSYYNATYYGIPAKVDEDTPFSEYTPPYLYQGNPNLYYYIPVTVATARKVNVNETFKYIGSKTNVSLKSNWGDGVHYNNYINLGVDVLVESIQVWYVKSTGTFSPKLLAPLDPIEMSPSGLFYRLDITPSGEYFVVFGDGQWGTFVTAEDQVFVSFLRLTNLPFVYESSRLQITDLKGSNFDKPINLADVYTYYIYQPTDPTSVVTASNDLQRKISYRRAMSTKTQIQAFLNTFPEIVDSCIVPYTGTGATASTLSVLYIPRRENYISVLYIKDQLELYSSLIYDFRFLPFDRMMFVHWEMKYKSDVTVYSFIQSDILSHYVLPKCAFGKVVSSGEIISYVYQNYGILLSSVKFYKSGSSVGVDFYNQTEYNTQYLFDDIDTSISKNSKYYLTINILSQVSSTT